MYEFSNKFFFHALELLHRGKTTGKKNRPKLYSTLLDNNNRHCIKHLCSGLTYLASMMLRSKSVSERPPLSRMLLGMIDVRLIFLWIFWYCKNKMADPSWHHYFHRYIPHADEDKWATKPGFKLPISKALENDFPAYKQNWSQTKKKCCV